MRRYTDVNESFLATWPLPSAGSSKYERGQIVVVGGALRSPGAALLAGQAALRAGAGRLTLAVARSVAPTLAVALPECGVLPLNETRADHIDGGSIRAAQSDIESADAVLIGPGLDDGPEAHDLLRRLGGLLHEGTTVALDAFALGAIAGDSSIARPYRGRLIMTPNDQEAEMLLGHDLTDPHSGATELADKFDAVVSLSNCIAAPDGSVWNLENGNTGLATSGSGDVLAGTIAGLAARGASLQQAAVWGTWAHHAAGDVLLSRYGGIGFLASEIASEIPHALNSIHGVAGSR